MITLSATINGKPVPLTDCDWVLWRPCGCPQGVTVGAFPHLGHFTATEDEAWREWYPATEARDEARRDGFWVELMTHERYCREVSDRMIVRCPHA